VKWRSNAGQAARSSRKPIAREQIEQRILHRPALEPVRVERFCAGGAERIALRVLRDELVPLVPQLHQALAHDVEVAPVGILGREGLSAPQVAYRKRPRQPI